MAQISPEPVSTTEIRETFEALVSNRFLVTVYPSPTGSVTAGTGINILCPALFSLSSLILLFGLALVIQFCCDILSCYLTERFSPPLFVAGPVIEIVTKKRLIDLDTPTAAETSKRAKTAATAAATAAAVPAVSKRRAVNANQMVKQESDDGIPVELRMLMGATSTSTTSSATAAGAVGESSAGEVKKVAVAGKFHVTSMFRARHIILFISIHKNDLFQTLCIDLTFARNCLLFCFHNRCQGWEGWR